jgi:hypothetical protein
MRRRKEGEKKKGGREEEGKECKYRCLALRKKNTHVQQHASLINYIL